MPELWLVCEGGNDDDGGIDKDLISRVFTLVLSAEIVVESTGGDTGLKAAACFLRRHRGGTVAYISDRDYRCRAEADSSFTDGTPGFIWRRHEIENYLLHPAVVAESFKRLQASLPGFPDRLPPWARSLPDTPELVTTALRQCAAVIAPQEAGRMCLWRLREETSETVGRVQYREPDFLGPGQNPEPTRCRQALIDESARILAKASEVVASPLLASTAVAERYDGILWEVTSMDYIERMQFLEEFSGHNLLRQFQIWLRDHHGANFKKGRLESEFAKSLPDVYRSQPTLFGTDDFRDLANGVRALASLPPL